MIIKAQRPPPRLSVQLHFRSTANIRSPRKFPWVRVFLGLPESQSYKKHQPNVKFLTIAMGFLENHQGVVLFI